MWQRLVHSPYELGFTNFQTLNTLEELVPVQEVPELVADRYVVFAFWLLDASDAGLLKKEEVASIWDKAASQISPFLCSVVERRISNLEVDRKIAKLKGDGS